MLLKKFILFSIISMISVSCLSQYKELNLPKITFYNHNKDVKQYNGKVKTDFTNKNSWITLAEIAGLNLGVGAYNTYWKQEPWAKITFKTIENNFIRGFHYDEDKFVINQIAHPFHGSLYFNIARSNGYDFWQAVPFTAFGSLMWEFIMENDRPAKNDLISTTFGGIMLGEMGNKTASLLFYKSNKTWWQTPGNILGTLLDIPRFFKKTIREDFDDPMYGKFDPDTNASTLKLALGFSHNFQNEEFKFEKLRLFLQLWFTYGNLEKYPSTLKPFDFFRFRSGVTIPLSKASSETSNNYVYSYATLYGKKETFNNGFRVAGIFQDYDYIQNKPDYEIGSQSIGVGGILKLKNPSIFLSSHINFILLGALGYFRYPYPSK